MKIENLVNSESVKGSDGGLGLFARKEPAFSLTQREPPSEPFFVA